MDKFSGKTAELKSEIGILLALLQRLLVLQSCETLKNRVDALDGVAILHFQNDTIRRIDDLKAVFEGNDETVRAEIRNLVTSTYQHDTLSLLQGH
ncbi:hypothetical protein AJ78_08603 [Emergomyces pasteurianus Ep9510]|uniref:Uncharacterized protein n=1 Tax=Emergomyces pasteurianus Ep9510 TaxID=1447872 RepID=A0A1J9Q351_9EURO|nr:hypothetical protein AJ78_08603 [Emergomyces pasteurianus Ep9510]